MIQWSVDTIRANLTNWHNQNGDWLRICKKWFMQSWKSRKKRTCSFCAIHFNSEHVYRIKWHSANGIVISLHLLWYFEHTRAQSMDSVAASCVLCSIARNNKYLIVSSRASRMAKYATCAYGMHSHRFVVIDIQMQFVRHHHPFNFHFLKIFATQQKYTH